MEEGNESCTFVPVIVKLSSPLLKAIVECLQLNNVNENPCYKNVIQFFFTINNVFIFPKIFGHYSFMKFNIHSMFVYLRAKC